MIYKLEDRVLFDAALPVDIVDAAETLVSENEMNTEANSSTDSNDYSDNIIVEADSAFFDIISEATGSDLAETEESKDLYIIDTSVPDYQTILDALPEGSEVLLLEPQDSIDTITDALSEYENLDSLHIISHGSTGSIELGVTTIDSDSLDQYADSFQQWNNSLADGADILFYGCNVAKTAEGQQLITEIATLTSTDIAASADKTGATGGWDYEYSTGSIETNYLAVDNYSYNLTIVDGFVDQADLDDDTTLEQALRDEVAGAADGDTITFSFTQAELDALGTDYSDLDGDGVKELKVTLTETLTIANKGLTINGDIVGIGDGQDVVLSGDFNNNDIIDDGDGTVISIAAGDGNTVELLNLGVTEGKSTSNTIAAGIHIAGGTVNISNTTVENNTGRGVVVLNAIANINNGSIIRNNSVGVQSINDNARVTIEDSQITGNTGQGIIVASSKSFTINDSIISGNGTYGIQFNGGAVDVKLTNTVISDNTREAVYAIGSNIEFTNTTLSRNSADFKVKAPVLETTLQTAFDTGANNQSDDTIYYVTTTADEADNKADDGVINRDTLRDDINDGDGLSLREAIYWANLSGTASTITFSSSVFNNNDGAQETIVLSKRQLERLAITDKKSLLLF